MNKVINTEKFAQIARAADGGGILANQILGSAEAVNTLNLKLAGVRGRIARIAAGRTPSNTDAAYAQIIADQLGKIDDNAQYNNPDAAFLASQAAIHAFRTGGLAGLAARIELMIERANAGAAPLYV